MTGVIVNDRCNISVNLLANLKFAAIAHRPQLMSHPGAVRRKSLRIPSQPVQAPIPPSLLQSPHLNSPQSIFRRAVSPRVPRIDDEWLQDTVPQNGAAKPLQQETKTELARPPFSGTVSFHRPAATPSGRPVLPSFGTRSEPNLSRIVEQDGYFIGL
ncbi:hypothetical protein B0H15DRAFT_644957 [Mycena belliarum]|uniref:Uncharacterized protein n=1 Tax=Mycena belliarum TaxID=1033014 RepID=A0AAD6UCB7_9AGAR|nr:hypothetical protein B0H15DRAFT_644957 [Mycena belliae]